MAPAASVSAFRHGSDELGVFAQTSVDQSVFSETAILKTAYWFTDLHYLFITKNRDSGFWDVELRLKQQGELEQLKAACGEFWNHLLDQEVRQKVLGETSSIRDALIARAFLDARAPMPPDIVSDESRRPTENQDYVEDPLHAGQYS